MTDATPWYKIIGEAVDKLREVGARGPIELGVSAPRFMEIRREAEARGEPRGTKPVLSYAGAIVVNADTERGRDWLAGKGR